MEIVGIGTDIVDMNRLQGRWLDRMAQYVFDEQEMSAMRSSRNTEQFLGSRFALKEAIIKAFPFQLTYRDIHIDKKDQKITATVPGHSQYRVFASLSHEHQFALAYATVCK